jgi:S1-C subfamily serine protease
MREAENEVWPVGGPPRPMNEAERTVRENFQDRPTGWVTRVVAQACTALIVRTPEGDERIGTAFHVGEGVYLTARHVLEHNEIVSIIPYNRGHLFRDELTVETETRTSLNGKIDIWNLKHDHLEVTGGPYYHKDNRVDVAAIRIHGVDANTPSLALGHHYDDWIADEQWLLTSGIVLGYPPVPMSNKPIQLTATVEVNGVVDTYRDRYVRFIVSGAARGGFSGGPVWHEYGFVLGMVTESLEMLGSREPGFLTVLSIEALHELLDQHQIVPECQKLPTDEEIIAMVRGREGEAET